MRASHAEFRLDALANAAAIRAAVRGIAIVVRIVGAAALARTANPGDSPAENGAPAVVVAGSSGATAKRQRPRQEDHPCDVLHRTLRV